MSSRHDPSTHSGAHRVLKRTISKAISKKTAKHLSSLGLTSTDLEAIKRADTSDLEAIIMGRKGMTSLKRASRHHRGGGHYGHSSMSMTPSMSPMYTTMSPASTTSLMRGGGGHYGGGQHTYTDSSLRGRRTSSLEREIAPSSMVMSLGSSR